MFIPWWQTIDDGMVAFPGLVMLELEVERPVRRGIASKDHDSAGDLIQPVNNPQFPKLSFELLEQVRGIFLPAIRQHRDPGGFVNYKYGRVLKENIHEKKGIREQEAGNKSKLPIYHMHLDFQSKMAA
jgi:hypothetical protein